MSRLLGLLKRFKPTGDYVWHIDKCLGRFGRLCESTKTSDRKEAERYLLNRIHQIREIGIYGSRPRRKFHEAATKYLAYFAGKSTIDWDAAALKELHPYIGNLWLDQINNDSFSAYRNARQDITIITRNSKIGVVRRILKLAAEVWWDGAFAQRASAWRIARIFSATSVRKSRPTTAPRRWAN